ncbi:class I lanthipeptide [Kordia sp.]|uniref:class I lanthipeptide n=1 Tax=Kordia sp. TaxID=1965332 RepID=UPI003D6B7FA9
MKKQKLKNLSLNKKSISNLSNTQIKGGLPGWLTFAAGCSDGCSDGCGSLGATLWNCTEGNCSADCDTFACDTGFLCTSCPGGAANPMNPGNPQGPSGE